jgi:hypothetical protein
MGVLLVWAQVDDPLAIVAAAAPIALVCLVRACVLLVRRRRSAWYAPLLFDGALAVAAVVSIWLASLAVAAIKSAGGYSMQPLGRGLRTLLPFATWGHQLWVAGENLLILFGADFYEQPAGIRTAIAFLHFAGVALAACGLLIGITCLVRGADRVTQILTVAVLATVGAGAFATQMILIQGAHDIAVVLPFGAVLAGRTLAGSLQAGLRRRPRAVALLAGALLACYGAGLGYAAAQPSVPPMNARLATFLAAHHLTSGIGGYWESSVVTVGSNGAVTIRAVASLPLAPYPWEAKSSWYDPGRNRANFLVTSDAPGFFNHWRPKPAAQAALGRPVRTYHVGHYTVYVYDKNLLAELARRDLTQ